MKRKILLLVLAIVAVFSAVGFAACETGTDSEENSDKQYSSTLQLLSFETVKNGQASLGDAEEAQTFAAAVKSGTSSGVSVMKFSAGQNFEIEETETDRVQVVATVKNENRDSFIDLVLYVSYLNTKVVFNEGNGEYVCATTTKLEDGIWITDITLSLNLAFDSDYLCNIKIDEINFLHSGSDVLKADLNSEIIRRIDYGFTGDFDTEYGENGQLKQGDIVYEITGDGEVVIVGNSIADEIELEIPDKIIIGKNYLNKNGTEYAVVQIGDNAFCDCGFIKSLTIPESVRYIGHQAFAGCGEIETSIPSSTQYEADSFEYLVDMNKTQLYVSNFDGALGREWLYRLKQEFEELYKDTSFRDGEKGVQIVIDNTKRYLYSNLLEKSYPHVFVTEGLDYKSLVYEGKLLDITDTVQGTLSTFGENNTIESKLYDEQKAYLKTDGKYYAIPNAEAFYGFTYDADLFDEMDFYYLKNGNFGNTSGELSAGADGVYGTYDDGLPATYEEFFRLCDRMVMCGVIPMIFSGKYAAAYMGNVINSLIVDYNGYESERVYYNYNGTVNKYVSGFDGDVPVKSARVITLENGYDLFGQAGYYYGFSFLDRLYNAQGGGYLSQYCRYMTTSHIDAQAKFLYSSAENKPIAMLAEGTWWQNEAMETRFGPEYSAGNRNLKFMPLPKATADDVGTGRTMFDALDSYIVINSNTPESIQALAKLFVQFCNTDEHLRDFTITTNMTKALKYELTADDYEKLTPFGQSVIEMKKSAQVIYPCSDNAFYQQNAWALDRTRIFYDIISAVRQNNFDAKQYFIDFVNGWKNEWESTGWYRFVE